MILSWKWLDWKGFIWFFFVWFIYETVYRLMARVKIKCYFCDYSPYLFLTQPQKGQECIHQRLRKALKEQGYEVSEAAFPIKSEVKPIRENKIGAKKSFD